MIRVFSEFDDELCATWRILEGRPSVLVFQTLVWCRAAWETFVGAARGARLNVIVWTGDKGETPVLMPTFIDASKTLRFIGDEHSDCGDALYEPGVNKHRAFSEIVSAIRGGDVRSVSFQKFRAGSEALQFMGVFMRDALVYRDHAYSWLELPKGHSFTEGQPHFRARERSRIKAIDRKSEEVTLAILSSESGDAFPGSRIEALLAFMRKTGLRSRKFFPSTLVEFARRIYDAGVCDIAILTRDGEDLAISFQMRKDSRVHCWIMLYRDAKWNTPLRVRHLERIAPDGATLDFGVGAYGYKMETFRPSLGCTFALRWGRSLREKAYAFFRMNWRFARGAWRCGG